MTMKVHIDVKNREVIAENPCGTMGFVTWRRLTEELFREANEITEREEVTHVTIDKDGITFRIGRK
jgi:hypothetical protein